MHFLVRCDCFELASGLPFFDGEGKNRKKLTIPLDPRPDAASGALEEDKSEGCVSRWNVWVDLSKKTKNVLILFASTRRPRDDHRTLGPHLRRSMQALRLSRIVVIRVLSDPGCRRSGSQSKLHSNRFALYELWLQPPARNNQAYTALLAESKGNRKP
jgi:hypothetical protein